MTPDQETSFVDTPDLRELLAFEDPTGVLTVTVGFPPEGFGDHLPTAPREIAALLKQRREEVDGQLGDALQKRLAELGDDLGGVLDPKTSGQGRMLLVGLDSGRTEEVRVQRPLENAVHVTDRPVLRALVEALDEARPAGILVLHGEEAVLLGWALGEHEVVADWSLRLGDAVLADEFRGPSGGGPRRAMEGQSHVERRDARKEANRDRWLGDVADDVRGEVERHGWGRLVLVGPAQERNRVREALGEPVGVQVLDHDAVAGTGPRQVVAGAVEVLERAHTEFEEELVDRVIDRAMSGGAGALGVPETADALNQGRVHHLVVDADARLEGVRAADSGMLFASADDPRARGMDLHEEERMVHRMVQRAFETDAEVTPVDGLAASKLGAYGAVGALLRW